MVFSNSGVDLAACFCGGRLGANRFESRMNIDIALNGSIDDKEVIDLY